VLRDVLELGNDEAAKALGMTRSVLRHHLAHRLRAGPAHSSGTVSCGTGRRTS
jgi:hypothetical protein